MSAPASDAAIAEAMNAPIRRAPKEDKDTVFDVVVVGGGPSGATAATDLARAGYKVALLDRAGRIKPCGGAIPPRLVRDFDIPDSLMCNKVNAARIFSPSGKIVDMPIQSEGYVGMVDRDVFDEWLRDRAALVGAVRLAGTFLEIERDADGLARVRYRPKTDAGRQAPLETISARLIIGADGANSAVARAEMRDGGRTKSVFAYHEIVETPETGSVDGSACEVHYKSGLSPDFYAWVFPHGHTISVGTGSAHKGFGLKDATAALRASSGLDKVTTIRREGAPIPLKPLKRWDNGRDVLLAGDAAGVVAPASGEGIYYAMLGGRLAAQAGVAFLKSGDARMLKEARRLFMKDHGRVFWVLGMMQYFWYSSDSRRERFVKMCGDKDVQRLTWESYMNKELVRGDPLAHVKIFFKDLAHLFGIASAR